MASGYPPAQQPGYPPAQQPGYPPAQQPGYPPAPGSQPSAPFDQIGGYENTVGLNAVAVGPPPPFAPPGQPEERPQERYDQNANITDSEAKDALIAYVGENCCFGKSPAHDLSIVELKSASAYHYVLESFTESRKTNWHQEPYKGQAIDGPMNGPAPGPWDVYVQLPAMFQKVEKDIEVPHTAAVKPCSMCQASGSKICKHCHGRGRESCTHCHGNGEIHHAATGMDEERHESCPICQGHGDKMCTHCKGNGRIKCATCDGNCQVKTFIKLTVNWAIIKDEHIVEKTALRDELIASVSGVKLFSQEYPMVYPLTSFFDPDINQASQRLVNQHAQLRNTSRVHMQRHNLRSVPVNEVEGKWEDTQYRFFVFGLEHKVDCPDYPQQCCWGCTII